jgi:Hemerythrin HHE cation binding domain
MRRDPALVSLSHDHHQALFVARALRRAGAATATDARGAFLAYWDGHGRTHFRLEEEILLPAYAGYGDPHHPLVARALCEHVAIRHRADEIARSAEPSPFSLRELGSRLAEHVHLEERALFPLIERALPPAALSAVASALAQAERTPADG